MTTVCYSQAPIKRNKKEKTEQSQSVPSNSSLHHTHNNRAKESTPTVNVSKPDGYINGHGYVDLGLPSGTKWAICNVGAKLPSDYGDYFGWGDISVPNFYGCENKSFRKEISQLLNEGIIDSNCNLNKNFDVASTGWGEVWCMPTKREIEELTSYCKWKKCYLNRMFGYKATGPNGKSIFFPFAGIKIGDDSIHNGINDGSDGLGYVWSSTPWSDDKELAWCIRLSNAWGIELFGVSRYTGCSVRAVLK